MTRETLHCTCGREVRVVRLGRSLLTLGHVTNPGPDHHSVHLSRASRSAAKHHTGARAALVRGPLASQPSGTPDMSPRQRPRATDRTAEAEALSNDRTSIPSGRSSPAGRARAAEGHPPGPSSLRALPGELDISNRT